MEYRIRVPKDLHEVLPESVFKTIMQPISLALQHLCDAEEVECFLAESAKEPGEFIVIRFNGADEEKFDKVCPPDVVVNAAVNLMLLGYTLMGEAIITDYERKRIADMPFDEFLKEMLKD